MVDNLIILPEEMQGHSQNLTQEDENKIKENINNELKKVMIDNKDAIEIQEQFIFDNIKQSNRSKIITNVDKTIDEISKYEFDGDQVVVTFSTEVKTEYKQIDPESNKEEEKENIQSTYREEITLQKVDGIWKIVYSYLDYNQGQADLYMY